VGAYRYNRQFVARVREAGIPLIWQLKPDIFAFPVDGMCAFAEASTYILMNHIEAQFICKALELDSPEALLNDTTQALVITSGAQGCTISTHEGRARVRAVTPPQVVDTTGAGDAFTAGFLAGVLRGCDLKKSAQIGSVVASFVLESVGCQTNLPDWDGAMARYTTYFGHYD
jgi:sugar/nucleoside kinase (ribokinase family)